MIKYLCLHFEKYSSSLKKKKNQNIKAKDFFFVGGVDFGINFFKKGNTWTARVKSKN